MPRHQLLRIGFECPFRAAKIPARGPEWTSPLGRALPVIEGAQPCTTIFGRRYKVPRERSDGPSGGGVVVTPPECCRCFSGPSSGRPVPQLIAPVRRTGTSSLVVAAFVGRGVADGCRHGRTGVGIEQEMRRDNERESELGEPSRHRPDTLRFTNGEVRVKVRDLRDR